MPRLIWGPETETRMQVRRGYWLHLHPLDGRIRANVSPGAKGIDGRSIDQDDSPYIRRIVCCGRRLLHHIPGRVGVHFGCKRFATRLNEAVADQQPGRRRAVLVAVARRGSRYRRTTIAAGRRTSSLCPPDQDEGEDNDRAAWLSVHLAPSVAIHGRQPIALLSGSPCLCLQPHGHLRLVYLAGLRRQ